MGFFQAIVNRLARALHWFDAVRSADMQFVIGIKSDIRCWSFESASLAADGVGNEYDITIGNGKREIIAL